MKNNAELV